jgi:hypothetical protein
MTMRDTDISTDATPALFQHCQKVYAAMMLSSVGSHDHDDMPVYTGKLTHLFTEVGLGQPYYTQVMAKLKDMGCVRQLVRGGGQSPSKWLMIGAPTMDSYGAAQGNTGGTQSPNSKAQRALEQQNRDLSQRVQKLEGQVTRLTEAVDLQKRKYESIKGDIADLQSRQNIQEGDHV